MFIQSHFCISNQHPPQQMTFTVALILYAEVDTILILFPNIKTPHFVEQQNKLDFSLAKGLSQV